MSSVKLTIEKPGLFTTLQDIGRVGYQDKGVPLGGPLDRQSAHMANELVGNESSEPVIEITLMGPKIRFEGHANMAITGADLSAKINDQPITLNQTVEVAEGDILTFGKPIHGARAYLAIAGKWKVRKWLGSASPAPLHTDLLTPDSILKTNSAIEIETGPAVKNKKTAGFELKEVTEITVMKGPEYSYFEDKVIEQLLGIHQIGKQSNRMGMRLESKIQGYVQKEEMVSSGILPGTIQITPEGQPIVLLADAQTVGGYPRVLIVISDDLDKIGQLKPGNKIRLVFRTGFSKKINPTSN